MTGHRAISALLLSCLVASCAKAPAPAPATGRKPIQVSVDGDERIGMEFADAQLTEESGWEVFVHLANKTDKNLMGWSFMVNCYEGKHHVGGMGSGRGSSTEPIMAAGKIKRISLTDMVASSVDRIVVTVMKLQFE